MYTVTQATQEHGSRILEISEKTGVFTNTELDCVSQLWDEFLTTGQKSGYTFLVCKDTQNVLGYACFGPHSLTHGTFDLFWIAVDPDTQLHGIGHKLLQKVEEEIVKQKGRLLVIETSSTPLYQSARQFYQHCDYALEATIHDFYAPDDHLLIFTKHLHGIDDLNGFEG